MSSDINTEERIPDELELRQAVLYLYGPHDDGRVIWRSIVDRLIFLGILSWRDRAETHLDFTNYGELVYKALRRGKPIQPLSACN